MLVEASLTNNTDVLVAMANLRAAQASLLSANAALWPTASIGADASNRRTNDVTTENYSADFGASWRFSFGGRDIAARRVADLNAQAKAMLLEETKMQLHSSVLTLFLTTCI